MTTETETKHDVVIYEKKTRKVVTIAGSGMPLDSGTLNSGKRCATALSRINKAYDASIVPAGRYKVGDSLPEGD